MGATYMAETIQGPTARDAYANLIADLTEDGWTDPADKPGYVQVWADLVDECAVEWMRGWTAQHPPADLLATRRYEWDRNGVWGAWLMFPLASGGWHFFGWVNT